MEQRDDSELTLHKHLNHLAFLDKCAWRSFKSIKVEKGPNPYNFRRAIQVLSSSGSLHWANVLNIHLFWVIIAHASMLGVVWPNADLMPYICTPLLIISLVRFFRTWEKYRTSYYLYIARDADPLQYAFGTENTTLFIKTFEEKFRALVKQEKSAEYFHQVKIKDFDALVKLNKAAQEKEDVNLGIAETVKKALYGAILLAIVKLDFAQFNTTIEKYSNFTRNLDPSNLSVLDGIYLAVILVVLIYLIYDLFIGQTRTKRYKKTYLLILNMAKESWVETSKKTAENGAIDSPDIREEVWKIAKEKIDQSQGLKKIATRAFFAWVLTERFKN